MKTLSLFASLSKRRRGLVFDRRNITRRKKMEEREDGDGEGERARREVRRKGRRRRSMNENLIASGRLLSEKTIYMYSGIHITRAPEPSVCFLLSFE